MGESLLSRYDGLICDLDGVVYRGGRAVAGAVESLTAAGQAGVSVVYATNNASRPPGRVAEHLRQLGLQLRDQDVVNSSMAGARAITERFREGGVDPREAGVLAIGGPGVTQALQDAGLAVVNPAQAEQGTAVSAVLQGYGKQVTAADLAEAAYAIQQGAWWVASNTDSTLPTDRGIAPGNGSLVAAVRAAVDHPPFVVGKPHTPLYELSLTALGAGRERTLAIGDRLDTDVAGAHAAGMDALLVLTGVHGVSDVVLSDPANRPRYVLADLRGLDEPYVGAQRLPDGTWRCGRARVRLDHGADRSEGTGGRVNRVEAGTAAENLRAELALLCEAVDSHAIDPSAAQRLSSSLRQRLGGQVR